jgi:hypothetical protein
MKRMALLILTMLIPAPQALLHAEALPLGGTWRFQLDPGNEGQNAGWFKDALKDTIRLPGTTDENHKGPRNTNTNFTQHLSRLYPYYGAAWYQRDVEIPPSWRDKRITLHLERTKMTRVWVDQEEGGSADSLATRQAFDLSRVLTPGRHRLTICVDNKKHPPVSGGHQLSDDTQTDWNGIIGRLELRATDRVWLDTVQVYPDAAARRIAVRVTLGNQSGREVSGTLELAARSWNGNPPASVVAPVSARFEKAPGMVEVDYDLGQDARLWDEFSPVLYKLAVKLRASAGAASFADEYETDFGLRDFAVKGTQFSVNGKIIFLRGKHDACVFPLTGYPPMEVDGWVRVFTIAKAYGLNHYRFHSWCPPEAAFAAADRLGVYLQPELPCAGGDATKPAAVEYMRAEGQRILREFGNHPSFALFALGNEMYGGRDARGTLINEFRHLDDRHLYAQSSNYEFGAPKLADGDEYWTTFRTRHGGEGNVRGSYSHADKPLGHVQIATPATTNDYAQAIGGVSVPVIGHEVGQYQVFPHFEEIPKYTGVLKPWNLEVFRRRLEAKGMLDEDKAFVKASGALAVINYREDVEAALRTKGFGGFQLLDVQDFPGQGTALVGILDAFMDSKGLITPAQWRQFCAPVVTLARFSKYAWSSDETFAGQIQVANYGPSTLTNAVMIWRLQEAHGREVAEGRFAARDIPQGSLTDVGTIHTPLAKAATPTKLQLTLGIEGTEVQNHYDLWVYPARAELAVPAGVTIARSLDEETMKVLADGGRVLLLPDPNRLPDSVEGFFAGDFWCFPMFRGICQNAKVPVAPGTLGILCDPNHPAFAQFPTESHSNWQWWPILMHARAVVLDDTPASYRPLVQVIDNFERNHKLGLIFETRVGPGRLLVCTADLQGQEDQPESRQLLASLLAYAGSAQFHPTSAIPVEKLILPASNEGKVVFADDFETPSAPSPPANWAMWGAQQDKVPANYTRDTAQRHGGQASFRIHHPAKTQGYIVSAPDRAIQPRPGMIYTVSFWARAEKAGKALFQWTAYRSLRPFVDAPSPGSLPCAVDRQWRLYTYPIRAGLDFFAAESRFLLLTFQATSTAAEEQTLWIDDVRVTEQTDPQPVALVNVATIPHAALAHRLQPGDCLDFTVDAANRLRPATRDVGGVSFHRVCGWTGQPYDRKGVYTLRPETEEAIRALQLPMTRFYAVGDEPFGLESALDKVAEVCRRVGVQQDHCVLEFEEQGASRMLSPETWARGVSYSRRQGYRFHHWEIANEPYSSLWGRGGAFPTPEAFIAHFQAVSGAIRHVDPQAQIGMDIDTGNVRWGNYVLQQLAGYYDFVAPHYYCGANVHQLPFEDITLSENYRMLDRALGIQALLRAYNGDRPVYQYDTEWGMICRTTDGKEADYEDRNANVLGTVHRAVRLIYYAREEIVRGASGWQMLSRLDGQGFGILSQDAPDQRFLLYWLYYYFNRHVGQWVLPIDGTAPYHQPRPETGEYGGPLTPVLATLSGDGNEIYLVIANGSWTRAVPCRVKLRGFSAAQARGVVISSDKLEGKPLLKRKEEAVSDLPVATTGEEVNCTLGPHAVAFVTLSRS